jgi:hypothetical protein
MHRVDVVPLRQLDDVLDVQIRLERLARFAYGVGLVRLEPVERVPVLVRVHRHGADAQLVSAAKDADGDLAAIGDEQAANRFHGRRPRRLNVSTVRWQERNR